MIRQDMAVVMFGVMLAMASPELGVAASPAVDAGQAVAARSSDAPTIHPFQYANYRYLVLNAVGKDIT